MCPINAICNHIIHGFIFFKFFILSDSTLVLFDICAVIFVAYWYFRQACHIEEIKSEDTLSRRKHLFKQAKLD